MFFIYADSSESIIQNIVALHSVSVILLVVFPVIPFSVVFASHFVTEKMLLCLSVVLYDMQVCMQVVLPFLIIRENVLQNYRKKQHADLSIIMEHYSHT